MEPRAFDTLLGQDPAWAVGHLNDVAGDAPARLLGETGEELDGGETAGELWLLHVVHLSSEAARLGPTGFALRPMAGTGSSTT